MLIFNEIRHHYCHFFNQEQYRLPVSNTLIPLYTVIISKKLETLENEFDRFKFDKYIRLHSLFYHYQLD